MSNPLRNLPAVDAVLSHPQVASLSDEMPLVQVTDCARQVIETLRSQLRTNGVPDTPVTLDMVAQQTVQSAQRLVLRRLRRVINATGIVLHTNLGRAPLADAAIERMCQSARSTNVELDLESGRRSRRGACVDDLLTTLTGAPAAMVVNNCAAATMLALQGVAAGKEVVISRGQLVEIGGGFRMPEVFEAAGVTLREVGTSNRTRVSDYEAAINENTAAILRVHRSNFRLTGFVSEPSAAELVAAARRHDLPMIDDLGSGCLQSLAPFGLQEPDVATSLQADSDLLLFSGDKLLGGPQAGVLLGSSHWIEHLRRQPMARATRVCKLTLAALEATLEEHLAGRARASIPTLAMLSVGVEEIRERCEAIVTAVDGALPDLTVVSSSAEVGGGSLADQTLESCAVCIGGGQADRRTHWLRTQPDVPLLGRIDDGAVILDLRTVRPEDDAQVVQTLREMADALRDLSR